ncbi:MAG: helix-turn-helix transcriptional regulator [Treponema sp.]|nr:helix-turn-helix transcriptional regulator [Treponema sp.]
MSKHKYIVAKQKTPEEQVLKNILSDNIKKYRNRRNWSQFALAEKINISTNFLADIEAGNTWVSSQTLTKFAQAFEIDAFELLIPNEKNMNPKSQLKNDANKKELYQFSQDLTVVLQESINKAINHVKKQYKISSKSQK